MDRQKSKTSRKQKLTLSLDKDVIRKAKKANINISEMTEQLLIVLTTSPPYYLKDIVDALELYRTSAQNLKNILGLNGL